MQLMCFAVSSISLIQHMEEAGESSNDSFQAAVFISGQEVTSTAPRARIEGHICVGEIPISWGEWGVARRNVAPKAGVVHGGRTGVCGAVRTRRRLRQELARPVQSLVGSIQRRGFSVSKSIHNYLLFSEPGMDLIGPNTSVSGKGDCPRGANADAPPPHAGLTWC